MYFHKIHHPANFQFARRFTNPALKIGAEFFELRIPDLGDSVFRFDCKHPRWPCQFSRAELAKEFPGPSSWSLAMNRRGVLEFRDGAAKPFLRTQARGGFGVSGKAWLLQFQHEPDMQFYGMGEKTLGLELSRQRTKFWNADVWADFSFHRVVHESADPMYLSIPYLIVKRGNTYAGLLINNPYAVFMATAPDLRIVPHLDRENRPITDFYIGAPDGVPEIYFIAGPTLDELTRKMQRLCGVTPRPPIWALGHHQCRWGYQNGEDLDRLDREFRRHKIPCDGLWIDIDYMHGYRVFTIDRKHFPNPKKQLAALASRGRHIIPIIDPGVKVDKNYSVFRDGLKRGVFCRNPSGSPFVGFVWPGATAFPDFSMSRTRAWWARHVRDSVANGFAGAWIDMNDPSTGPSEPSEMLFNAGRDAHETYHNQYANGMAIATKDGLDAARPGRRQFILTRSGFIGIQRHAAVWTGDNYSNENHLRRCIPISLNLAMSGVPFNGPDVPGFGGDATPELAMAWYKACFLFPFFRNHSAIGTRHQEPWAFGGVTTKIIGHFIRLRYKLLPYLYNLFIAHERTGTAILRPLFYDFADLSELPLGNIADQFLVGPAIMQAPFVSLADKRRSVVLPDAMWFDASNGRWIRGRKTVSVKASSGSTPMFIRDGILLPMQSGEPVDQKKELNKIEIHIFLSPKFRGEAVLEYTVDDGDSLSYQRGSESRVRIFAERDGDAIRLRFESLGNGAGKIRARFVVYSAVRLIASGSEISLLAHRWRFAGGVLSCRVSSPITLVR